MARPKLGSRYEVGSPGESTLYEVASLDGPMAPRCPVALRILRPAPHRLAEWDRLADRLGVEREQYREIMRGALFSVPWGWLDMPFVRPAAGRAA